MCPVTCSLTCLALVSNSLEHGIPEGIASLTRLERLLLSQNRLKGYIPDDIGNLTALKHLAISNNRLIGECNGRQCM